MSTVKRDVMVMAKRTMRSIRELLPHPSALLCSFSRSKFPQHLHLFWWDKLILKTAQEEHMYARRYLLQRLLTLPVLCAEEQEGCYPRYKFSCHTRLIYVQCLAQVNTKTMGSMLTIDKNVFSRIMACIYHTKFLAWFLAASYNV